MRKALLIGFLPLISFCPSAAAPKSALPEQAQATLLNMRIFMTLLEAWSDERGAYPGPTDGLVPLESLLGRMDSVYAGRIPRRDGWGHRFLYQSDQEHYVLLSTGDDGTKDRPYETLLEEIGNGSAIADMETGDDVIVANGKFLKRPLGERDRQKITMTEIRTIAVAMESYAVDNDRYATVGSGIGPVEALRSLLEPIYVKELPTRDAWGHPILIWSNGEGYMIVSSGADGLEDLPYGSREDPWKLTERGAVSSEDQDLVFLDGQFVRWAKDMEEE